MFSTDTCHRWFSSTTELEFEAVRLELELFSPEIAKKPYVVAYNKMDLPDAFEKWPMVKETLNAHGIEPFCMSAVQRDGTHEVISSVYELLKKYREANAEPNALFDQANENLDHVAKKIDKERRAAINEFEIFRDSGTKTWHVVGAGFQRFVQMTNWRYMDSDKRFQHVLDACGVNKSLRNMGVKESDTVVERWSYFGMTQPMVRAVLQILTRLRQTQSDGLNGNEPSLFECLLTGASRCGSLFRSQISGSNFLDILSMKMKLNDMCNLYVLFNIKINM